MELDLRDLTEEHFQQALPNVGGQQYSSSCIYGVLLPEDVAKSFDEMGSPTIASLAARGRVSSRTQSRSNWQSRCSGYSI